MTEVLYQGEYVDKDWLNMWLNTPEGKRIHEEEKAREKAAAEEERKKQQQLQKQKQAENKSREKKVQEYFLKFRQEYGPDASISDELAQRLWQRARNAVENDAKMKSIASSVKRSDDKWRNMKRNAKNSANARLLREGNFLNDNCKVFFLEIIHTESLDSNSWPRNTAQVKS